MDTGEIGPIIERPKDWLGMVKKYEKRQEEALAALQEKKKAETAADLQDLAKRSIVTRALRGATGKGETTEGEKAQPIGKTEILTDASDPKIKELRVQLQAEMKKTGEFARGHFERGTG